MKYNDLYSFTYSELLNFTNQQISLDKLQLLEEISKNEINIPDELAEKLLLLCKESIKSYEEATGQSCDFVQPINNLSLKDKLECAKTIVIIIDKTLQNDTVKKLGVSLINKLFDIFN